MNNKIFRQKSIDSVNSPENLNATIKIINPSIWIIIAGVAVLLLGGLAWSIFGKLETCVACGISAESNNITMYVKEENVTKLEENQLVRFDSYTSEINSISHDPIKIDDSFNALFLHKSNIEVGDWVYVINATNVDCPDGYYSGEIVVDIVSPITFIFG